MYRSAVSSIFCAFVTAQLQVTVLQDDGFLAEYVHILADSALVSVGDRVAAGQPLCASGDAGFCPSPHLHLQLQRGEGDSAPTVRFALLDGDGHPYFPVAGKWYGVQGEVTGSVSSVCSGRQNVSESMAKGSCARSVANRCDCSRSEGNGVDDSAPG